MIRRNQIGTKSNQREQFVDGVLSIHVHLVKKWDNSDRQILAKFFVNRDTL